MVLLPPLHEEHAGHGTGGGAPCEHSSMRLDRAPAATMAEGQGEGLTEAAMVASATSISYSLHSSGAGQAHASLVVSEHYLLGRASQEPSAAGEPGNDLANGLVERLERLGLAEAAAADQPGEPGLGGSSSAPADAADGGHIPGPSAARHSRGGSGGSSSQLQPHGRSLHRVESRGSSLSSSSGSSWAGDPPAPPFLAPRPAGDVQVVTDDPCRWLFFRGEWGETDAPIIQPWFLTAEPPLSRTALLRLFGHFWPEPRRV